MLRGAASDPGTLVLGVDANAAGMAAASRRAAASARKGGRPNAAFVVAAAEMAPAELSEVAGLVTVRFPWGSLLRGCVGLDAAVASGIAGLVKPRGCIELLLAPSPRDGLDGVPTDPADLVAAVRRAFETHGFAVAVGREATTRQIEASGSTWAKRLAAGTASGRLVTYVRLVRGTEVRR